MLNLYPSQSEESNLTNEPTDDELKKQKMNFQILQINTFKKMTRIANPSTVYMVA